MLFLIRMAVATVWLALWVVLACFISIIRPFHRSNLHFFAKGFRSLSSKILGIEVEMRNRELLEQNSPSVFIANHQTNYDLFLFVNFSVPGSVTLGKREILFFPIFGLFYWLTGNVLINRSNKVKAMRSMQKVKQLLHKKRMSVLIMPEGTRSKGRGLLPFKRGAFHTAIGAEVPIMPICVSSWLDHVNLNRWKAGKVILEVQQPVETKGLDRTDVRELALKCHDLMEKRIHQLDHEVKTSSTELLTAGTTSLL